MKGAGRTAQLAVAIVLFAAVLALPWGAPPLQQARPTQAHAREGANERRPQYWMVGRVLLADGRPAPSGTLVRLEAVGVLALEREDLAREVLLSPQDEGWYSFGTSATEASYRVHARHASGYCCVSHVLHGFPASGFAVDDLHLAPPCRMRGRLLEQDGSPAVGIELAAANGAEFDEVTARELIARFSPAALSGADGSFALDVPTGARINLYARAAAGAWLELRPSRVPEPGDLDLGDLTFRRGPLKRFAARRGSVPVTEGVAFLYSSVYDLGHYQEIDSKGGVAEFEVSVDTSYRVALVSPAGLVLQKMQAHDRRDTVFFDIGATSRIRIDLRENGLPFPHALRSVRATALLTEDDDDIGAILGTPVPKAPAWLIAVVPPPIGLPYVELMRGNYHLSPVTEVPSFSRGTYVEIDGSARRVPHESIELERVYRVAGTCKSTNGEGVAGCRLHPTSSQHLSEQADISLLARSLEENVPSGIVRSDGAFDLFGLAGTYAVFAARGERNPTELGTVELPAAGQMHRTLLPIREVRVPVVEADDRPLLDEPPLAIALEDGRWLYQHVVEGGWLEVGKLAAARMLILDAELFRQLLGEPSPATGRAARRRIASWFDDPPIRPGVTLGMVGEAPIVHRMAPRTTVSVRLARNRKPIASHASCMFDARLVEPHRPWRTHGAQRDGLYEARLLPGTYDVRVRETSEWDAPLPATNAGTIQIGPTGGSLEFTFELEPRGD